MGKAIFFCLTENWGETESLNTSQKIWLPILVQLAVLCQSLPILLLTFYLIWDYLIRLEWQDLATVQLLWEERWGCLCVPHSSKTHPPWAKAEPSSDTGSIAATICLGKGKENCTAAEREEGLKKGKKRKKLPYRHPCEWKRMRRRRCSRVWSKDSPAASEDPMPDQAAGRIGKKLRLGTREGVVSREGVLSFIFVLFNWQ